MSASTVLELTYHALQLTLVLILPVTVVSVLTGLVIAFLEAITQIQDQSIGTSVKLIVVMLTLMATAHWMGGATLEFARMLFGLIATVRAPVSL
jgi:type III secretion protein S